MPLPASNPFATRFTRPGARMYRFPPGVTAATLASELRAHHGWGEIVGPHGSGKSTLLHALANELKAQGRKVVWFTQAMHERRLQVSPHEVALWDQETQIIIDGYEQLGWLSRRWLKRTCRHAGAGLLATSHATVGLPRLWTTAPTEAMAQALVDELLSGVGRALISEQDVSRCYQQHAGNLREMLFALYDLYELRSAEAS